jgi:hypothetical protein
MRTIETLCLALALAGCVSSAERDERQRQRMAANAEASCRAIGLDKASERWTDCMIEMMAAENRSERARRAAAEAQGGDRGLSFMCKDAISRGDTGGTFIFC